MTTYAILQDMSLCIECQACRVACQMQNQLAPAEAFIRYRFAESGTYPRVAYHVARLTCFHCQDAPCVDACPTYATYKARTKLTHHDPEQCSSCGRCAEACPFGHPVLHNGKMLRCTGCPEFTKKGKEPACVGTCITGALSFGPRQEMLARAERRVRALKGRYPDAQVYSPEGVGGTGLIWVLRERPEVYGLPAAPTAAAGFNLLRAAVQPAGTAPMAAAALLAGAVGWVIDRRETLRAAEKEVKRS
ncbi:MAG: 4Fe-4S dicluster domain-containing protein [Bacillota bacterium]